MTSKSETPKQLRLPFAVSKAKLQTFFVNESGQPVSSATFRKRAQLQTFCTEALGMSEVEFKKRKSFFGDEVTKILEKYQIEVGELLD